MSSRYYYKKKNRKSKYQAIQDVFNPTMQKAPFPNYYQQKGRTIQTSPLHLWQQDGRVITRKDLDKMYKKLLEYKYPIIYQLAAVPTTFLIEEVYSFGDMFSASDQYIFTTQKLNTLMNEYMYFYYPKIYGKFTFHFSLVSFQFNVNSEGDYGTDVRFQIGWQTNLLNEIRVLVEKNVDEPISSSEPPPTFFARPAGLFEGYYRITTTFIRCLSTGSYSLQYDTGPSNDPTIGDNGSYPFIDTSAEPTGLYRGQLVYRPIQGSISLLEPRFRLFVLCKAE